MTDARPKNYFTAICLVLALGTAALYWPITRHPFVIYDDAQYVTGNTHVTTGLSWPNFVWAFKNSEAANWHPVTWLSHQLDCTLFGVIAGGHRFINLLFHVGDTLLLFVFLRGTPGAMWRSAFIAALFAWHPLHVESVAWASERKDVLSTFFWLLTLMAYGRYVKTQSSSNHAPVIVSYLLALLLFACGLMSKPMVVTLPFVLLLLDFWPLKRFERFNLSALSRLVIEKIPFFALMIGSCLMTIFVQKPALWSSASLSFQFRLANAFMSYVRYLSKIFCPANLALIYPYPHFWPLGGIVAAAAVLVVLSIIFVLQARR